MICVVEFYRDNLQAVFGPFQSLEECLDFIDARKEYLAENFNPERLKNCFHITSYLDDRRF